MIKKLLLFTATCGFLYVSLSSNAGGPAHVNNVDATGRNSTSCAQSGCHNSGGAGTTTASIELRFKDAGLTSPTVTGFIDGFTYLVTLKGSNPNYSHFGFQLLAVEGDNNGTTQAGTFGGLPANVHTKALSGVDIVEHTSVLSGTGNDYEVTVEWTAPNPGPSQITIAGILNAVNNNGISAGDMPSAPIDVTLQNTTSVESISSKINIKAYPNPIAGNYLNLDLNYVMQGAYDIHVYSINGSLMYHNELNVASNNAKTAINTERWAAGHYIVHINRGDAQKMITVVKN